MVILGSFGVFPTFDNLVSRKRFVVEQTEWNSGLGGEYLVYTGYVWQLNAWGNSGVIRCISNFRQSPVSKTAWYRAKWSQIWVSGVDIKCIQVTFESWVIKIILGQFGALLIFNNFVSRKIQVLERNIHLNLCFLVLCGHCLPSCQAER